MEWMQRFMFFTIVKNKWSVPLLKEQIIVNAPILQGIDTNRRKTLKNAICKAVCLMLQRRKYRAFIFLRMAKTNGTL